jgi:hypothetical protein
MESSSAASAPLDTKVSGEQLGSVIFMRRKSDGRGLFEGVREGVTSAASEAVAD